MRQPSSDDKIYVAGHTGLVGSALVRKLVRSGFSRILTRSRSELDLRSQSDVMTFFESERPDFVYLAAATVGGILANAKNPATFIYDNLMIQTNVIHAAYQFGVQKLVFIGSSCIYPKECTQPITESALLTGPLEATNEAFAVAKIAGIKMCQSYYDQYHARFICLQSANLYGPNDNFDLETSHVLPALLRKFVEAKQCNAPYVTLWGTGNPRREFLHVDDLASAAVMLMAVYEERDPINVGYGSDVAISELAALIREIVGYSGHIVYDTSKPDGTFQKRLDTTRIRALGWAPTLSLNDGISQLTTNLSVP